MSSCFRCQIGQCRGACIGEEMPEIYNERAALATLAFERTFEQDMLLLGSGRTPTEQSVVLIEDNQFRGFGYVEKDDVQSIDDLKLAVKSFPPHKDYLDIIAVHLKKGKGIKVLKLEG